MRIVDVVYDDYALVHTVKTKDGVSEVLNKLYSKSGSVTAACALRKTLNVLLVDSGFRLKHCVFAGRSSEASALQQQKFTQLSLDTGILPDNIAILPKNGM